MGISKAAAKLEAYHFALAKLRGQHRGAIADYVTDYEDPEDRAAIEAAFKAVQDVLRSRIGQLSRDVNAESLAASPPAGTED